MTETVAALRKPMPVWALAVAALVVGVWNAVQLPFLADYAAFKAVSGPPSLVNLAALAFLDTLISVLTVWAFLLFVFRGRYDTTRAVLFAMALAVVAFLGNAVGVPLALYQVIGHDGRVASAADKAAVRAGRRFEDPVDQALVAEAIRALQKTTGEENLGALAIHSTPGDPWRTVCGDVAYKPGARVVWAGFVARKRGADEGVSVVQETDAFSDNARAKCRPLVMKYLGEPGGEDGDAVMAFSRAGCKEFDRAYWMEWKAHCAGEPEAVAAPAR